jgi:hypothetical protein
MRRAWPLAFLAAFFWHSPARAQAPVASPGPQAAPVAPAPGLIPVGEPVGSRPLAGLILTGEILYVWPNRDGLGTAVVTSGTGSSAFSSLESLFWDGTPALRLGARYRLPESLVDFGATFTYFHASTQSLVAAPAGGSLYGVLATDRRAHDAAAADGDAGLSYAVLDLDAGQAIALSDVVGLRLLGGVRLASIDQTLKCVYTGGALGDAPDFVNSPIRFQGVGLTCGAEATWDIYRGWGFYGRGRFGLVSGVFHSRRTETVGADLIGDTTEDYFTIVPVAEMSAGVSYQGERLFFSAGYELTDWLNMVSGLGGTGAAALTTHRRGDLTLQALTVRLGFAF